MKENKKRKTPKEEVEELINQKLEKRKFQLEKERLGYDAGWIDALKWALPLIKDKSEH